MVEGLIEVVKEQVEGTRREYTCRNRLMGGGWLRLVKTSVGSCRYEGAWSTSQAAAKVWRRGREAAFAGLDRAWTNGLTPARHKTSGHVDDASRRVPVEAAPQPQPRTQRAVSPSIRGFPVTPDLAWMALPLLVRPR